MRPVLLRCTPTSASALRPVVYRVNWLLNAVFCKNAPPHAIGIAFGGSMIVLCAGRAARCCVGLSSSAGHELHWMVRNLSCLSPFTYVLGIPIIRYLAPARAMTVFLTVGTLALPKTNLFVRLCLQQGSAPMHARQRVDNHSLRDSLFIVQLPQKRRMHALFDVYSA